MIKTLLMTCALVAGLAFAAWAWAPSAMQAELDGAGISTANAPAHGLVLARNNGGGGGGGNGGGNGGNGGGPGNAQGNAYGVEGGAPGNAYGVYGKEGETGAQNQHRNQNQNRNRPDDDQTPQTEQEQEQEAPTAGQVLDQVLDTTTDQ